MTLSNSSVLDKANFLSIFLPCKKRYGRRRTVPSIILISSSSSCCWRDLKGLLNVENNHVLLLRPHSNGAPGGQGVLATAMNESCRRIDTVSSNGAASDFHKDDAFRHHGKLAA